MGVGDGSDARSIRWALIPAAVAAVAAMAIVVAAFHWTSDPTPEPLVPGWGASVQVLAGSGTIGSQDGESQRAQFTDPYGVAIGPDALVYVADGNRIRVVGRNGEVATFAGGAAGFVDGVAQAARFDAPSGLAFDRDGTLYVADAGNNAIRRISPAGETTTVAGSFNGPLGVAVAGGGRIFVADTYNDRIRVITLAGEVATLAGNVRGFVDGAASEACFDTPTGLAVDLHGTLYVADTGNDRLRAVAPDGGVSTVLDASHGLRRPLGVATAPTGELYVTTEDGRVFERAVDQSVRIIAGSTTGFRDGPGGEAQFWRPSSVAWQGPGRLVVGDAGNAMVRRIAPEMHLDLGSLVGPRDRPQFDAEMFALRPLLWPVDPLHGPFEVAGTMGEARGEDAGRFHAGIDVRVEEGREVLAVRDGIVLAPLAVSAFGTINESIRIGPLAYVHVRAGRSRDGRITDAARFAPTYDDTGRLIDVRVKRGARFAAGDVVGTVNSFNHVHLNVGWPGEEYNPLLLRLAQFRDSIPPSIASGGIYLYSQDGARLTARANRRLLVSGDVRIVVDAWDQADGNQAHRRLGLFELGYQVLLPDGQPAAGFESPHMTIRFDRLGGDPVAAGLVYATGSGIPFYGGRRTRFLYVVTNTFRGGKSAAGMWRSTDLPPGDYTLRIHARDVSGNAASRNRDLAITIVATAGDRQSVFAGADSAQ